MHHGPAKKRPSTTTTQAKIFFFFFQISCPVSDCSALIPNSVMEKFMEDPVVQKQKTLHKTTVEQHFLTTSDESNSSFSKKCPICSKTVSFVPDNSKDGKVSHSVDCGSGHFFCWECGASEGHAPVGCGLFSKWLEKCGQIDDARLFPWLETNARGMFVHQ